MPRGSAKELANALQKKRKDSGLSLREAATQIGIGSSTLLRIEKLESVPDEPTRVRLANWLSDEAPEALKAECLIEVHFRAAKNLDSATVRSLAEVALKIKEQFGAEI